MSAPGVEQVVDSGKGSAGRDAAHSRVCRLVAAVDGHGHLRNAEFHERPGHLCVQQQAVGDHLHAMLSFARHAHDLVPVGMDQRLAESRKSECQALGVGDRQSLNEALEPCERHVAEWFLPSMPDAHRRNRGCSGS